MCRVTNKQRWVKAGEGVQCCDLGSCWKPLHGSMTCRTRLTVRPQCCHQGQSVQGFPDSHQAHRFGKCLNTSSACTQTSAEVSGPPLFPHLRVCWTSCTHKLLSGFLLMCTGSMLNIQRGFKGVSEITALTGPHHPVERLPASPCYSSLGNLEVT